MSGAPPWNGHDVARQVDMSPIEVRCSFGLFVCEDGIACHQNIDSQVLSVHIDSREVGEFPEANPAQQLSKLPRRDHWMYTFRGHSHFKPQASRIAFSACVLEILQTLGFQSTCAVMTSENRRQGAVSQSSTPSLHATQTISATLILVNKPTLSPLPPLSDKAEAVTSRGGPCSPLVRVWCDTVALHCAARLRDC